MPTPAPDAPPESVTDLLAALVRINSVNPDLPGGGSEAVVIDAAEGWMQSWGISTERLPVPGRGDQLLATVPATRGTKDDTERDTQDVRLFDSHVDTVAVDGMTIDPFGALARPGPPAALLPPRIGRRVFVAASGRTALRTPRAAALK